jgi:cysteine desulfuration protein SufE
MFESCQKKQEAMKQLFASCQSAESKYKKIIELGKAQKPLLEEYKTEENRVSGCQSRMYLRSTFENGAVFFESDSDAIISAGLALLLVKVYSGESPETILKCPPNYIEELGLSQTLTPGRANGLASMYLRMKQDAFRYYMKYQSNK